MINFMLQHPNRQQQIKDIYNQYGYFNKILLPIEYIDKTNKFNDWRDEFIEAYNAQLTGHHKCPRIVLHGEPNCGKSTFVNKLFGKHSILL
jgi:ribosome biogenesis GTPase A